MNDYEQLAEDLRDVINDLHGIGGVDPDIEQMIDGARKTLERAEATAKDRA